MCRQSIKIQYYVGNYFLFYFEDFVACKNCVTNLITLDIITVMLLLKELDYSFCCRRFALRACIVVVSSHFVYPMFCYLIVLKFYNTTSIFNAVISLITLHSLSTTFQAKQHARYWDLFAFIKSTKVPKCLERLFYRHPLQRVGALLKDFLELFLFLR